MPIVLGLDLGLASFGCAVVDLTNDSERLVEVSTMTTEKSAKKRGTLVADDDIRRIREICRWLSDKVVMYSPVAICAELPSGSKGARAAQALGAGKAIVAALSFNSSLPLAACSPVQLKKSVTGSGSASKEDISNALVKRFGQIKWPKNKTHMEHAADALGAVVACLESDVIKMARKMSRVS